MENEAKPKEEKAKKPKGYDMIRIPLWLANKALNENLTLQQLLVYCWIFDHNKIHAAKDDIFGRPTIREYTNEIAKDLGIAYIERIIKKLSSGKAWIEKTAANPFGGKQMIGFRCLLDSKQREDVRVYQQKEQLQDEKVENKTTIESSIQTPPPTPDAPGKEEIEKLKSNKPQLYINESIEGKYFYKTPDGKFHEVVKSAIEELKTNPRITKDWTYNPFSGKWEDPNESEPCYF